MTNPTLWAYDQTGRAILPDWAGAIIETEMASATFEVDAKQGNLVRFELPDRYNPRRTFSWSLYEAEITGIREECRRLVAAGREAAAYRYAYHTAKVAAGEPMVTVTR